MEDMYLRLDQDIEHFLTFIDQELGLKNVLIYVTADNAAANAPSFMLEKRMPGGYFNYNSAISLLKTYLNVIYGTGDWVSFYYAQQIFLNRELIEDSKLSISEFQDRVVRFMIQFEGVSNALSADDLIRNNYTHGTFEMMQKSYSQKRSGDILLRLNPGWVEKGIERQYASSYHYDSHVPLIWYGWKIGREEISRKLSVTDIVPTIASFLNISRPPAVQGNVIRELLD
jgi:arylsulfatase A-like enzyme